jgi:hypothetical protein
VTTSSIPQEKTGPGLHLGDGVAWLEAQPAGSLDGIFSDPPWGAGPDIMGQATWQAIPSPAATRLGGRRDAWDSHATPSSWTPRCSRWRRPGMPSRISSSTREDRMTKVQDDVVKGLTPPARRQEPYDNAKG